jgi:hypothetical protein
MLSVCVLNQKMLSVCVLNQKMLSVCVLNQKMLSVCVLNQKMLSVCVLNQNMLSVCVLNQKMLSVRVLNQKMLSVRVLNQKNFFNHLRNAWFADIVYDWLKKKKKKMMCPRSVHRAGFNVFVKLTFIVQLTFIFFRCLYSVGICRSDEFRCADGSCAELRLKCDRFLDCLDGSDEFECGRCPWHLNQMITIFTQL